MDKRLVRIELLERLYRRGERAYDISMLFLFLASFCVPVCLFHRSVLLFVAGAVLFSVSFFFERRGNKFERLFVNASEDYFHKERTDFTQVAVEKRSDVADRKCRKYHKRVIDRINGKCELFDYGSEE